MGTKAKLFFLSKRMSRQKLVLDLRKRYQMAMILVVFAKKIVVFSVQVIF